MDHPTVLSVDLVFQGIPGVIASYLLPHAEGVALVESGPGTTQVALERGLVKLGYSIEDVTDVFLTHIHLDHAGASGWLAQHGANIHVHSAGAPHLVDPEKLLASATRIYGDQMEMLWGQFLPVNPDRVLILYDGEMVRISNIEILPLATPGHASHHMVFLYDGVCFSGDVGGVRLGNQRAIRVPMPPPEFHLETWRTTLKKIASHNPVAIAPTHFGIYNDPEWHFTRIEMMLDEIESWMETHFTGKSPQEQLRGEFDTWIQSQDLEDGLYGKLKQAFELANPSAMSLDGMLRYWRKYRTIA